MYWENCKHFKKQSQSGMETSQENIVNLSLTTPTDHECFYLFQQGGRFRPKSRTKLGFYILFNRQGHIGTGSQDCHLFDLNTGDCL